MDVKAFGGIQDEWPFIVPDIKGISTFLGGHMPKQQGCYSLPRLQG